MYVDWIEIAISLDEEMMALWLNDKQLAKNKIKESVREEFSSQGLKNQIEVKVFSAFGPNGRVQIAYWVQQF